VPGYGLLAHHRVFGPTLLISCSWLLARLAFDFAAPFSVTAAPGHAGRRGARGGAAVRPHRRVRVVAGSYFSWSRRARREAQLEAATRGPAHWKRSVPLQTRQPILLGPHELQDLHRGEVAKIALQGLGTSGRRAPAGDGVDGEPARVAASSWLRARARARPTKK